MYFGDLQFMAVKILQIVCRNRAHGKYLKLNGVGFSENFSQYARNSTGKASGGGFRAPAHGCRYPIIGLVVRRDGLVVRMGWVGCSVGLI